MRYFTSKRLALLGIGTVALLLGVGVPAALLSEDEFPRQLAEPHYNQQGQIIYWKCDGECLSTSEQCCEVVVNPQH